MQRTILILVVAAALAGCQTSQPSSTASPATPASRPTGTSTSAKPATATLAPAGGSTASPSPVAATPPAACGYRPVARLAELQDRAVREASALVASQRAPGVFWTLNDSGNEPLLFAFDRAGRRLGAFRVEGAQNEDWESLQLGPGRGGGYTLYIGDAGDNNRSRRESVIYRIPEPEISPSVEKPGLQRTAPAEAFRFTMPGGSRDVEAMLVHPTSGEVLLISKEFNGHSRVYRLPTPLDSSRRVELQQVTELDLSYLGLFGNLVTDAAVSPDLSRVVVRTYLAALEYDLAPGAALASIWSQRPRAYRLDDGPQGEGITYRADGRALLTIGESSPAVLWEAEREC